MTPDGRETDLTSFSPERSGTYSLSQDERLQRRIGDIPVMQGMFGDPQENMGLPLQGPYEMRVEGFVFEPESDIDAEFVLYGKVSGMAGTDHHRRDLSIALLWGRR